MSLPWVRLDTSIYTHDKIVNMLRHAHGRDAICTYIFSIAWSASHETDGHIPEIVLPIIHGSPKHAALLLQNELWEDDPAANGWWIHNFAGRQALAETKARADRAKAAARVRWDVPPPTNGHNRDR